MWARISIRCRHHCDLTEKVSRHSIACEEFKKRRFEQSGCLLSLRCNDVWSLISIECGLKEVIRERAFDTASSVVLIITAALFASALFTKDLTHDLLFKTGLFLISAKRIMMQSESSLYVQKVSDGINELQKLIVENLSHSRN